MSIATELSTFDDPTGRRELLVMAGFLAGYGTATRNSYATDLRIYAHWCAELGLCLFEVQRSHLELFGQSMEGESRTLGLDRNELSAFMVQAGIGTQRDHALASLLGLNGLRVSEALNADIDDLGFERGHHVLQSSARAANEPPSPWRPEPPEPSRSTSTAEPPDRSSSASTANGWTATPPTGPSSGSPAVPGSTNGSAPTASGTASSPPPSTPASPCEMSRTPPATRTHGPPCATTGPATPSTATPPTSSPPSSPAPADSRRAANDAGPSVMRHPIWSGRTGPLRWLPSQCCCLMRSTCLLKSGWSYSVAHSKRAAERYEFGPATLVLAPRHRTLSFSARLARTVSSTQR